MIKTIGQLMLAIFISLIVVPLVSLYMWFFQPALTLEGMVKRLREKDWTAIVLYYACLIIFLKALLRGLNIL